MARPTGRPPSRQPPLVDPSDISTSSERNNTSPAEDSINRLDIDTVNLDYELSLENVLDSMGMRHTVSILGNSLDEIHDMNNMQLFSQQTASLRGISPASEIPQQTQEDIGASSRSAAPMYQFNNSLLMSRDALPPFNANRAEILLSQLHLELCNLLVCVRSAPWDVQDTLRLTMSPLSNGSHDEEIAGAHPLIQVSKVSKELEKLLTSLRPSAGAAEHTPLTLSYSSGPPSLRTTQLLVALSCYIQIVSIYDSIFSTVFEHLANGSPTTALAAMPSPQKQPSTPTLYLCGLPILPSRKLWGTLLAHQIENQLEKIEILVGLPDHYRISSKSGDDGKNAANGLFAGQHSQSLLNAVFQPDELRPGEHDTRCVRSLKLKMRQIKDL